MRKFGSIVLAAVLSGCSTTTTLTDGRQSTVPTEVMAELRSLDIRPPAGPITLAYRAIDRCSYDLKAKKFTGASDASDLDVSIKSADGLYFLTIDKHTGEYTTALITAEGRIVDFNVGPDPVMPDLGRFNTKSQAAVSKEYIRRANAQRNPLTQGSPHVVNDISILFPEYRGPLTRPGEIAAIVKSEDGAAWGAYVLRGVTTYEARAAVVLELQRNVSNLGPTVMGFDIVDAQTAMPMRHVIYAGTEQSLWQTSCK